MKRFRLVSVAAILLAFAPLARGDESPPKPGSAAPETAAPTPPAHSQWSFREVGLVPVQGGGRIKPLDSFAREVVLYSTGSRSYAGRDPLDLMFSWLVFPDYWQ